LVNPDFQAGESKLRSERCEERRGAQRRKIEDKKNEGASASRLLRPVSTKPQSF